MNEVLIKVFVVVKKKVKIMMIRREVINRERKRERKELN